MAIALTLDQEFTIELVVQLLPQHWDVLSAFERQLCDQVTDRWMAAGPEGPCITDAEWPALQDAAKAMANAKAGFNGRAA